MHKYLHIHGWRWNFWIDMSSLHIEQTRDMLAVNVRLHNLACHLLQTALENVLFLQHSASMLFRTWVMLYSTRRIVSVSISLVWPLCMHCLNIAWPPDRPRRIRYPPTIQRSIVVTGLRYCNRYTAGGSPVNRATCGNRSHLCLLPLRSLWSPCWPRNRIQYGGNHLNVMVRSSWVAVFEQ